MPVDDMPTSVCTLGIQIDVYWHICRDPNAHVEAIVDALFESIDKPGRVWSPPAKSMVRAEFRNRIKRAGLGKLTPVEHVKSIGRGRNEHIFEIRWSSISVTETDGEGLRFRNIQARLLHTEPQEVNVAVVGLHTHEKAIYADDPQRTRREQNAEVDVAVANFHAGLPTRWGIQ